MHTRRAFLTNTVALAVVAAVPAEKRRLRQVECLDIEHWRNAEVGEDARWIPVLGGCMDVKKGDLIRMQWNGQHQQITEDPESWYGVAQADGEPSVVHLGEGQVLLDTYADFYEAVKTVAA